MINSTLVITTLFIRLLFKMIVRTEGKVNKSINTQYINEMYWIQGLWLKQWNFTAPFCTKPWHAFEIHKKGLKGLLLIINIIFQCIFFFFCRDWRADREKEKEKMAPVFSMQQDWGGPTVCVTPPWGMRCKQCVNASPKYTPAKQVWNRKWGDARAALSTEKSDEA